MRMSLLWIALSIFASVTSARPQNASVTWDITSRKFTVYDYVKDNAVATAVFTNEIFQTGWSYLEVKTAGNFPDPVQAYAAGLVEGHLTKDLLGMHWNNIAADYCDGEVSYCQRLQAFLNENLVYINANIADKRTSSDYWHQVALVLEQLSGLEDGFHNVSGQPRTTMDTMGLMLMNVMGDLEDLEAILNRSVTRRPLGGGSCSALIKVLPNNKDLYFAHDSWTSYNTMLRILKKYELNLHVGMEKGASLIPGRISTFSSQPGTIGSGDDFYLISSGLATVETTIGNGNSSLWKYITPKGTVLEWIRSIIANRLARNGQQWANLFSIQNSGTYNNQWMILDYNKFSSGQPLRDDLLWVSEQLPGYIHNEDVTYVLRKQGYWPSYNVPFFEDIFNLSGGQANAEKYGDWFTYSRTPRALIFKRDQPKVHDIPSMIKLMRYNNFTKDPLSRCNCTPPYSAENAIAARCDLNPINGSYPFAALGHRPHGATDMKLTSSTLFKNLLFIAIGGPTHDPLPPFQWSKSDYDVKLRHEGHPDLWTFKPIIHRWQ